MNSGSVDSDCSSKTLKIFGNRTLAIFLVSVLGLYLELLLIRWIGTEVRIFAYLQNTILVVCFMGLGMGCFTSRRPVVLRNCLFPLSLLALIFSIPNSRRIVAAISQDLSVLEDLVIWYEYASKGPLDSAVRVASGLVPTFAIMALVWLMFVPLGRLLGRLLDEQQQVILAYSVNILGSLIGIWVFVALSTLFLSPLTWFIILSALLLYFVLALDQPRSEKLINVILLVLILCFSKLADYEEGAKELIWSPYQKLSLFDARGNHLVTDYPRGIFKEGNYLLKVNNVGYQFLIDNSNSTAERSDSMIAGIDQFQIPALLHPDPRKILLVGAGTGNDAAGALKSDPDQIVAVEIDPAIVKLGRTYHPEQPYDSARVKIVVDDARSFFAAQTEGGVARGKYDVISFGLLDSHTVTAMTNARLDNFVYTRESIESVKMLLNKGGVLTLNFATARLYISDRIAGVIKEVFGVPPISFRIPGSEFGGGGRMFVVGDMKNIRRQIAGHQRLAAAIEQWQIDHPIEFTYDTEIITDDWPYMYLKARQIPILYYLLALMLLGLFAFCNKLSAISFRLSSWRSSEWHFFFLGAGFLLLEVQNISKAAVVLGSTWWVNAVIISAIMIMILLSNYLVYRFPHIPVEPVYTFLLLACLLLFVIDLSSFAYLPFLYRAVVVGALSCCPIFFSGIIFIRSFAVAGNKDVALGANLIGALIGGLLQSLTFITGIKALLLIVALLYLFAFYTGRGFLTVKETH